MRAARAALLPLLVCVTLLPARAQGVKAEDAVVLIRTLNSLRAGRGSGFLVGDGGWVVTASHVVSADLGKGRRASDRTAMVYVPWTGRAYEARVAAVDGVADIALLRLPQAGFPALPIEGLELKDADAALTALRERPLRLYGFPLTYGEATVASLARPQSNDTRLQEIAKRGETSLCVLGPCPDAQPGWSGGPVVAQDRESVVGVFHSVYRPAGQKDGGLPAGSVCGYLGDLLRGAGVTDLKPFATGAAPASARAPHAAERMAGELRSMAWCAAGEWKKAEGELRDLLKLDPDDALVRAELGRVYLEQQKYEAALKELQEAVRRAPRSMVANLHLGRACHLNYDPKGAQTALEAALEASPGEVEPQLWLATVHEENQQLASAETVLRSALSSSPNHPGVIFRLGSVVRRLGRSEEGLKLLAQASDLAAADPGLAYIPLGYGRALEEARKLKEAEAVYRQVQRTDPQNPDSYYMLALLFLRMNRPDDAQIQVSAAIVLPRLSEAMVQAFRALQARINGN